MSSGRPPELRHVEDNEGNQSAGKQAFDGVIHDSALGEVNVTKVRS